MTGSDNKKTGGLIICRADELLQKTAERKPAAVLSIEHPDATAGQGAAPRLTDGTAQLILSFWDSELPVAGGPDIEQVEQGLAFVMEHIAEGDVIIHCNAGKARSTALALGVLALLNPHSSEKELVDKLLVLRPEAAPNTIVTGMVDELTGRNGRLLQAVQDNPTITTARAQAKAGRTRWLENNPDAYKKMYPEKSPPAGPRL